MLLLSLPSSKLQHRSTCTLRVALKTVMCSFSQYSVLSTQ